MTLQFICAEIERLHLQIRRQQNEVFTLQRSGIGTASAELLLTRMQASVDALCIVVNPRPSVDLCFAAGARISLCFYFGGSCLESAVDRPAFRTGEHHGRLGSPTHHDARFRYTKRSTSKLGKDGFRA